MPGEIPRPGKGAGKIKEEEIWGHSASDGMVQAVRDGSLRGVLERMGNVLETVTVPAHQIGRAHV